MTAVESTPPSLRLGLQGWPHTEWLGSYFPEDLPEDWHFNYYANEASCLLLEQKDLVQLDSDDIETWLDEAPEHFRFYVLDAEHADLCKSAHGSSIQLIRDNLWQAVDNQQMVAILPYQSNLRRLRQALQQLPDELEAIIFTGDTNPRQLHEIRTLIELLGIA